MGIRASQRTDEVPQVYTRAILQRYVDTHDMYKLQLTSIAHCDGAYHYVKKDGTEVQTHYTVQLYLNDSAKSSTTGEGHLGGATSFLSRDEKRRIDIDPKAGSVLIFQHNKLYHEGAEVVSGVKYAMRSDILYRWEHDS